MIRVLVACESSGTVREAFRAKGFDAWSCDLLPADDGSPFHIQGDAVAVAHDRSQHWDVMICHTPCTRLANSGVRWLHKPPAGKTLEQMWADFDAGVALYKAFRSAPIKYKAIENPVMHKHARDALGFGIYGPHFREIVQPWWFGDKAFKATGFELHNLPSLRKDAQCLTPPAKGTDEHKAWSMIHRASPGPDRWKIRSKTFPNVARAMAEQWGEFIKAAEAS